MEPQKPQVGFCLLPVSGGLDLEKPGEDQLPLPGGPVLHGLQDRGTTRLVCPGQVSGQHRHLQEPQGGTAAGLEDGQASSRQIPQVRLLHPLAQSLDLSRIQ